MSTNKRNNPKVISPNFREFVFKNFNEKNIIANSIGIDPYVKNGPMKCKSRITCLLSIFVNG